MKFLIQIFKGRMFGHPIHLMLVHFPAALFPFSLILDLLALYYEKEAFSIFATYSLAAALLTGLMAMIFGIVDLAGIDPQEKSWPTAIKHAGLNILWLVGFSIALIAKQKAGTMGNFFILLSIICNIGMLYSNFLGGELVLKYKIGHK